MADLHKALGQDMLEESPEKLDGVEMGRTGAGTAHFPVREGDGTVCEAHETVVGNSDPEDLWGEGGEGGVAVVIGLAVDIPRDGPGLWIDLLQQTGLAHVFFEERAGDGRERFDRDKEVRSGGAPGRAVLREAPTRDHRVDMGVRLQLPTPGMQDAGEPRKVCPDEAFIMSQPLEGHGRGLKHGLVGEALLRADEGSERLRHGEGEKEVRPRPLLVQVVGEPLLGCMLLALGTVTVATGMIDAVLAPAVWALREAVAVVSAAAVLDGADARAVREGKVGRARQGLGRKGGEDRAEGGHGRSPCMRALRRS